MVDAGYAVVQVVPNPFRDRAPGVVEICSVSDCLSHRPENWIQSWLHNDLGWFNDPDDAAHMIPEGEEARYRLFAYRILPALFRRGERVGFDLPDNVTPLPIPGRFTSRGFDAVSKSATSTLGFDCSPLSCNDMAAECRVNAHCLFPTLEDALAGAERFSIEQPEPGDYYVIEVLEGRLQHDEPPAWEFGELAPDAITGAPDFRVFGGRPFHYDSAGALTDAEEAAMSAMRTQPAIVQLTNDVAATLGPASAARIEARARLLLPFADWPEDSFAARLIDDVQQEFHDTRVDTTWPHCAAHPNHPLWFERGTWRCTAAGAAFAPLGGLDAAYFEDALSGLRRGDFSRLAPLFDERGDGDSLLMRWHAEGRFDDHQAELAEALSCACFLGHDRAAGALIARGLDPSGGSATGLDAMHWAANRGQLQTVRMLIALGAPLETINMHGTTVLGTAVWSAIHEPRAEHLAIIEALLDAGAAVGASGYPSGNAEVDRLLERFGAGQ